MTTRRTDATDSPMLPVRPHLAGARAKDEVYRQMFLLEENRPGAAVGLAVALLQAWVAADLAPADDEERGWLKKVSVICLEMIEASMRDVSSAHDCAR